jgi:hypothetical protein
MKLTTRALVSYSLFPLNLVYQTLNADVHFVQHQVKFRVTPCLKARMADWELENLGDDLFSPSPFTSPSGTPPPTPTLKIAELPPENSDASRAVESLPSTAQARLKRRRKAQGRNNRAKKQCLAALEGKDDGPAVRAKAEAKYTANSTTVFTSTSATEFHVASTGYVGLNRCTEPRREYSLKELRKMGFDVLKWDGR